MVKQFKEKSVKIPVNPFYHHFSLFPCISHRKGAAPIPEAIPLIYQVIPRGLGEVCGIVSVYEWCGVVGVIGGKTFLHFYHCLLVLFIAIWAVKYVRVWPVSSSMSSPSSI